MAKQLVKSICCDVVRFQVQTVHRLSVLDNTATPCFSTIIYIQLSKQHFPKAIDKMVLIKYVASLSADLMNMNTFIIVFEHLP